MPVPTVHVVLPGGVDDPAAPSGGNTYDRRVCAGLAVAGWRVREVAAPGGWPWPDPAELTGLARTLAGLPDGALVLVDGLVGCAAPEVLVPAAARLRLVVLVHLPLADETGLDTAAAAELDDRERRVLTAAAAVVATSDWAGRRLAAHHGLPATRIRVAAPGVDPAPPAAGSPGGTELLCVAAVIPRKGQDVLVEALAAVEDLPWRCRLVGALDRAPGYVETLRGSIAAHGLADRVELAGPRAGTGLDAAYAGADLLVLPSHAETYGMVVTEALARGVPVLGTQVGGVPEALGRTVDGDRPGLLVPAGDPAALAAALRCWLTGAQLRRRLVHAARTRRSTLPGWDGTVRRIADLLHDLRPHARRPG